MTEFEEIDLQKIKTYAIADRQSKVNTANFARPYQKGTSLKKFISQLPNILIGADLKQLIETIVQAFHSDKQIIVMMGAHVIKCGLSPLIIQLMEAGIIKSLALNGAGIIHDTEIANWGNTSEDVAEALDDGSFGMVAETPKFINDALKTGQQSKLGMGEAVGLKIEQSNCSYKQFSLLWTGYRLKIPINVHVAIGTDILHQHPSSDGATIGELTHRDFKIFCAQVARLTEGSVVLNFGSAVILPEVFLKALSVARNLGYDAHGFTTANFDMLRHYRPQVNILRRPTQTGGKGYQFTGHHEIMIPLLVGGILEGIG
jgi:hypothetical protein